MNNLIKLSSLGQSRNVVLLFLPEVSWHFSFVFLATWNWPDSICAGCLLWFRKYLWKYLFQGFERVTCYRLLPHFLFTVVHIRWILFDGWWHDVVITSNWSDLSVTGQSGAEWLRFLIKISYRCFNTGLNFTRKVKCLRSTQSFMNYSSSSSTSSSCTAREIINIYLQKTLNIYFIAVFIRKVRSHFCPRTNNKTKSCYYK